MQLWQQLEGNAVAAQPKRLRISGSERDLALATSEVNKSTSALVLATLSVRLKSAIQNREKER